MQIPMNLEPSSQTLFSSTFQQPEPPVVNAEFKAHYKQHAYSPDFSHIASGTVYHSSHNNKVRVDATYSSSLVSSLFDYNNNSPSSDSAGRGIGMVWNTMYSLEPNVAARPKVWKGYVRPAFPLFEKEELVKGGAVFGGFVSMEDRYGDGGKAASWNIMYQDIAPVTVYVDTNDTVVGYDFFDPSMRGGIVTRYFNIDVVEHLDSNLFDFPI
ncbi:hypothetical protein MMC30_001522 [Trapelia coarctata]|nr:hypothetical protein [Trapelia coarctata]